MENINKKNPFLFPFITAAICAIMYFIAFHEERDKVRELEHQLEICKIKKQNESKDNKKNGTIH